MQQVEEYWCFVECYQGFVVIVLVQVFELGQEQQVDFQGEGEEQQ